MTRQDHESPAYRVYVMAILILVYTFNFLDRQIIGILAVPIKSDLGLSDTELGVMGGLAFALFYTALGIPVAMLADRANRTWIMTIALQFVPGSGMEEVTFDQNPFGVIGVRMAKTIGVHDGGGRILNSHGQLNEKEVFRKPTKWVDYAGMIREGVAEGKDALNDAVAGSTRNTTTTNSRGQVPHYESVESKRRQHQKFHDHFL